MLKSRTVLVSAVVGLSVIVLASQVSLPPALAGHLKALQDAQTLSGTVETTPLPGTPRTVKFMFTKPNMLKVESDEGFTVCDGSNIYTYTKAGNKYTVEPYSESALKSKAGVADVWAWSAFFNKDAFKDTVAKAGNKRNLKGKSVTEVMLEWQKPEAGSATVFVDDKTGVATGCSVKFGDKECLVLSQELSVGKEPADKSLFTFAAPSGATKVEVNEAPKPSWAGVQAIFKKSCMPCHSASNRKSGIDLSSYDGVMGSAGAVSPGQPEQSGVYRTTSGSRPSMPRNASPLTKAETQAIYDWIKAGAKNE